MKTLAYDLDQIIDGTYTAFSSASDWESKPAPDKWSGKQILGHLIDSAHNNLQRFVRGTYEANFRIVYNQNEWVKHQHYKKAPIEEIIQLWFLLNKQIVRIWDNYPEERTGVIADVGKFSPEFCTIRKIAEDYISI